MKKNINKSIILVSVFVLCLVLLPFTSFAAIDNTMSFKLSLTVNGSTSATVSVGDELSLQVELKRTDTKKSGTYQMYSMQDEIIFDSRYFSLIEGSIDKASGYDFHVRAMEDGERERVIISRLVNTAEGASTPDDLVIATFKLKTLNAVTDEKVKSVNYKVNTSTGDTYITTANDISITISSPGSTPPDSGGTPPGGSGGVGGLPAENGQKDSGTIQIPVTMQNSLATTTIKEQDLADFLAEITDAGPVTLDFGANTPKINTLNIPNNILQTINQAAQAEDSKIEGLKIPMANGEIEFDAAALDTVAKAAGTAGIKIVLEEATKLTPEQKAIVKEAPVYNISISSNEENIDQFNGTATIYLPYTLKAGQSPDGVVIYYVSDTGELINMKAEYDSEKQMTYFTTTHLSVYMVTYKESGALDNPSARYMDVIQDAWYREAVDFVLEKGLFVGTSDTTFKPNMAMSRAMLVTVLWRLEGEPAATSTNIFKDVAKDTWYEKAVIWASDKQVVSGFGDGSFKPNDNISREQMAAVLHRYAKMKGYDVSATNNLAAFTDAGNVSAWAAEDMKWAVGEGLISGMTTETLVPVGNATRAQVASILMRFTEKFSEESQNRI